MLFYWFLKFVAIGPAVASRLPAAGARAAENVPATGAGHPGEQPPLLRRLDLHAAVPARGGSPSWPRPSTSPARAQGLAAESVLRRRGQVPIDRTAPRPPRTRSAPASGILREGKLLGIYPEGTRSPDGRLYRGKTGVARMALETGAPVIPVAMVGTGTPQAARHRPADAARSMVRFGKPLDFSRYAGLWRTTASSCGRSPTRSCTRS